MPEPVAAIRMLKHSSDHITFEYLSECKLALKGPDKMGPFPRGIDKMLAVVREDDVASHAVGLIAEVDLHGMRGRIDQGDPARRVLQSDQSRVGRENEFASITECTYFFQFLNFGTPPEGEPSSERGEQGSVGRETDSLATLEELPLGWFGRALGCCFLLLSSGLQSWFGWRSRSRPWAAFQAAGVGRSSDSCSISISLSSIPGSLKW